MPTQILKTFNPSAPATVDNFQTVAALKAYINPLTCVSSDLFVTIDCYADITLGPTDYGPATFSDTQRVLWRPVPGGGVDDLERTTLDVGTTGIAINVVKGATTINLLGISIQGFRINISGSATGNAIIIDGQFMYNRVNDTSTAPASGGTDGIIKVGGAGFPTISDNLCVVSGVAGKVLFQDGGVVIGYKRNTIAARGSALNSLQAYRGDYGVGSTATNDVYIGCGANIMGTNFAAANCFSNTTPTSGRITGITVNTGANALVVNAASDYRPVAAGPLIGAASAAAQSTKDILGNNRGLSPDVGAWQLTPAAAQPIGSITTLTVSGRTVTVSGTSANAPSTVAVRLLPSNAAYNGAVLQGPVNATLGTNTWTVTFNNVPIGQYAADAYLSNTGGGNTATNNLGVANVVGAQGIITSQTINGQTLVVSGTTTGTPTSASCIVPAASQANGATTVGPVVVQLNSGTFSVSVPVTPGNYDAPVVRFTTVDGTSLPATGSAGGFSVIGITGNPQAPVTSLSVFGPSNGFVGSPSDVFTVTAPDSITSTPVVVTPASTDGSFNPTSVTLSSSITTATFTYTPASSGVKTISFTNNGGLTNPANASITTAVAATALTLTGPTSGFVGRDSAPFTVAANGPINGTVSVTPVDSLNGGTFTPPSFNLSANTPSVTFVYVAGSAGSKSININSSLTQPAAIAYASTVPAAAKVIVSGPTTGTALYPSTDFTVGVDGFIVANVVVTPSDNAGGGTFAPTSITLTPTTPVATFKYTPASAGSKSLSFTNASSLTNPTAITFTVAAGTLQPRNVNIVLGNSLGPVIGMANIKWTWQDTFAGPILSSATNGSTDGSGVFAVLVQSVLPVGSKGFLKVLGTNDVHFNGPVVVA